jgi:GTPase SAR1 family protein
MQTTRTKVKFVLLGDRSVGKTSIIDRFIFGTFQYQNPVIH